VQDEGEITGDVVVFFGEVHIGGKADHDVVNFFGTVKAENDTSIGNNLVSMFGSIRLGENVSVGRDLVAMFGTLHAADSATVGNNRVVQPGWILYGPLIFFGLIVTLLVHELRAWRRRRFMAHYPFPPIP
jgi:acetyltransferase-like isoleucine patch superfamily enzyme